MALVVFGEHQRNERRPGVHNFQPELPREIVAERRGTNFWDGKPSRRYYQHRSAKFVRAGSRREFDGVLNFVDFRVQKDLDAGIAALRLQHIRDVLRGAVAKKLAESFLVVGNAMLFHEGDEVGGRVPGEGGFGEVFVGADEILRATMDVREVAASSTGDKNFLADAVGKFKDRDAPSASSSFRRAKEPCGASAEDESIKCARQIK
jgi:hypothetical protein